MTGFDAFGEIARYYDKIMDYVNYDRWFDVTTALAELLPDNFTHVDAACGTGTLLGKLRRANWHSFGTDLSVGMLRTGNTSQALATMWGRFAAADLRAMPFRGSIDYVTSLFDSVNFLLTYDDMQRAFREVSTALKPTGLFYFDVVTERMVTEHFEGQEWTEYNGSFTTTWRSSYSHQTSVTETHVRVGSGTDGVFRERIYSLDDIRQALTDAGFTVLAMLDARGWKTPGKKTVRVDVIASRDDSSRLKKQFESVRRKISKQRH